MGWDILQNMQVPHYVYPHTEEFYREFMPYITHNKELRYYVLKGFLTQPYTYSFFKYASFPENLPLIKSVLDSKKNPTKNPYKFALAADSMDYEPPIKAQSYEPIDSSNIEKPNFNYHKVVDITYTTDIYDIDRKYMSLIAKLCKERGIVLYFICCHAPDVVIKSVPNYFRMLKSAITMFNELGVKYIDTYDENYFPNPSDNAHFRDCAGHFTSNYGTQYTNGICRWIKDNE